MPEPADRATYLRQVAAAVDLPPAEVEEVIEELSAHLDDATEGWRDAGLAPIDAERRSMRRLGDPRTLGRELGSAHHRRRHLLAAVGGGIFNTFAFGLWAYLTLWIVLGGLALIGGYLAWWALSVLGGSSSGWFTGPVGSAGTVIIATLWFAWLGWVLPERVARSARRSIRGVQTPVGIAGFAVGSLLLWSWLSLDIDPVLAVGLPLGPFAYLLATRHPNTGRSLFPASTRRLRAGIAVAVILGTAVVGLLTVGTDGNGSWGGGWAPGLEVLGADPMSDPVLGSVSMAANPSISTEGDFGSLGVRPGAVLVGGVTFADGDASAFERHFTALVLELQPAAMELPSARANGRIVLEGGPIAVASASLPVDDLASAVRVGLPALRTRTQLVAVLLGQRIDGFRVVLAFDTIRSPAWHGTLLDWWLASR